MTRPRSRDPAIPRHHEAPRRPALRSTGAGSSLRLAGVNRSEGSGYRIPIAVIFPLRDRRSCTRGHRREPLLPKRLLSVVVAVVAALEFDVADPVCANRSVMGRGLLPSRFLGRNRQPGNGGSAGHGRLMFESNFPPDKVSFSHHVLFNAFKRFSKGYSASERAILFRRCHRYAKAHSSCTRRPYEWR